MTEEQTMPSDTGRSNVECGLPTPRPEGLAAVAVVVFLAALAGVCAAVGFAYIFENPVGHDQSWLMYAARQMMHGTTLNGDRMIEENPPLIIWFMALPVLLGKLLRTGPLEGFRWFFDLVAAGSLVWCASLYRRLQRPSRVEFWFFVLFDVLASLLLARGDEVGQREHLLVLLLLPYLLLAAARSVHRSVGRLESVLIGVAAGVAVCLKPQHVLDVVLVEAFVLDRVRRWREWLHLSGVALTLTVIAAVASVFLFAGTYFSQVVPLLREAYWGFDQPIHIVIRSHRRILGTLVLLAAIFGFVRRRLRQPCLCAVLLLAGAGAAIAYVQQHKGFSYQLLVISFVNTLLAGLLLAALVEWALVRSHAAGSTENVPSGRWLPLWIAGACFAGALFLRVVVFPVYYPYMEYQKATLAKIYAAWPPGTVVSFYSPEPWEVPVVMEQNKVWGSRFPHTWLLPAIVHSQDPGDPNFHRLTAAQLASLSARLRIATAEDLERWKPAVVVVDSCGYMQLCVPLAREGYAGIIPWMSVSPAFRAQWAHYRLQQQVDGMQVYVREAEDGD